MKMFQKYWGGGGMPYFIISSEIKSDADACPFFKLLTAFKISSSLNGGIKLCIVWFSYVILYEEV